MAEVTQEVVVKGTVVRSLMKFIEKELTKEQIDSALSQVPDDFAARVKGSVLATATFPVKLVNRLTEASAIAKGEKPEAFAFRAGRVAASEAVKTIYKMVVIVLTPVALMQKGASMWRSIYSAGEFGTEKIGPGEGHVYLRDFPSEPIGCARISGWMTELGEMTRAKDLKIVHTKCAAKGANECLWSVSWKP